MKLGEVRTVDSEGKPFGFPYGVEGLVIVRLPPGVNRKEYDVKLRNALALSPGHPVIYR